MTRWTQRVVVVLGLAAFAAHGLVGHVHDAENGASGLPSRDCPATCPVHSGAIQAAEPVPPAPVASPPVVRVRTVQPSLVAEERPFTPSNPRAPPPA
jgi:hypothetical protein